MFEKSNLAHDHQQLMMNTMKKVDERYGMVCMLHEKKLDGVNGSGKHVNFSLGNSQFARSVFKYADDHGVTLTLVSSDINSANHNYPTNYNEAIYVAGSLPDTAPTGTCDGPGSLSGVGDILSTGVRVVDQADKMRHDVRKRVEILYAP